MPLANCVVACLIQSAPPFLVPPYPRSRSCVLRASLTAPLTLARLRQRCSRASVCVVCFRSFFFFFLFLFLKLRKGEQVLPGINRTRLSVLINSRVNGVKVRQKENKSFFFKRIFRIYREWKDTNFSFNFIYGSILKLVFFYSKWIYISFSLIMNEEMIHRFLISHTIVRNFGS